jgi:hypothetical protein
MYLYLFGASMSMSSSMTPSISEEVQSNIDEIELDVITSSAYFKPKPGTAYVIRVDLDKPGHKIKPVENPRFTDAKGKPLKRYEFIITHVNNQAEQTWTVSKTVCLQILGELRKGFQVMKVIRTGSDRSTTYAITGIQ